MPRSVLAKHCGATALLLLLLLIWHSITFQHMTFELNDLENVPASLLVPSPSPCPCPAPVKLYCLTNTFYELINVGNDQIRVGQDNSAWLEIEVSGASKALSTVHVTKFTVHC